MATITDTGHRLNHVEMVYRPGERALAGRVFELLGMRVLDRGGTWMTALVDPDVADFSNNACYASEVTPEQWELEQVLAGTIAGDDAGVGHAARAYLDRLHTDPQRSFHFGIRFHSRDDFDATLERVRATDDDPELAGRVALVARVPSRRARGRGAEHDPGLRPHRRGRRRRARVRAARRVAVALATDVKRGV